MGFAAATFNLLFFGLLLVVATLVMTVPGLLARAANVQRQPSEETQREVWLLGFIGLVGVLLEIGR